MEDIIKARIDTETKKKVMFILKTKGKTLSEEVRKMCNNIIENEKNSK